VKKILLFIAFAGALILIVEYSKPAKEVEVKDRLITIMASGLDLDSYSIFPPRMYAKIHGEVLNKSNRPLTNIKLFYLIGNDTLRVIINYLDVDGTSSFSTKEFEVRTASEEYTFLEINLSD
jgi:hypothetical protein